jgi:hypothetical protein
METSYADPGLTETLLSRNDPDIQKEDGDVGGKEDTVDRAGCIKACVTRHTVW